MSYLIDWFDRVLHFIKHELMVLKYIIWGQMHQIHNPLQELLKRTGPILAQLINILILIVWMHYHALPTLYSFISYGTNYTHICWAFGD